MTPTIRVQQAPFDIAAETAALASGRTDVGGIASFIGITRADDGLVRMVLEHYPGMTERAIAAIVREAAARWPLTGCTVIHRVGPLVPGEPIVLVLAASAHRAAALEACAFLIDWLKTRAPFWKREEFANGAARWVEARACDDEAAARWAAS
jgi:molybdopterin synthase catalytic subunit